MPGSGGEIWGGRWKTVAVAYIIVSLYDAHILKDEKNVNETF